VKIVAEPTFYDGGQIAQTNSVFLPPEVLGFSSKAAEVTATEVNWLPKDTLFGRRLYRAEKDGLPVQVSVVLMGTDRTSIHKPQYCLDSQGWIVDHSKSETAVIPVERPYPYDLKVMKLTATKEFVGKDGKRFKLTGLYAYWFVAENELTPYHGERMWWMARDLIRSGVLQRWAYVSYFTYCVPGTEQPAFNRLSEFIAASVPEFQLATGSRSPIGATAAVSPVGNPITKQSNGQN
jgi:hypothetical protein